MKDIIIGIDLAKHSFQVCVMTKHGEVLKNYKTNRKQLILSIMNLDYDKSSILISMEACGGSHYWGREFQSLGYPVKLIAAQYVKPFVKTNKNDAKDAEAICEASSRSNMRFVPIKTEDQQTLHFHHKIRQRLVRDRTSLVNEIRGFLENFGIVINRGIRHIRKGLPVTIEEHFNDRPLQKEMFQNLYEEIVRLDQEISSIESKLKKVSKENEVCQRLMEIPGVGYITATAVLCLIPNPHEFKDGRSLAAFIGLTPYQHSTGGKTVLLGISKKGNQYLRKLLVQGASSFYISVKAKKSRIEKNPDCGETLNSLEQWHSDLKSRGKAIQLVNIATANKLARIIWHVLMGCKYETRNVNEQPLMGYFANA